MSIHKQSSSNSGIDREQYFEMEYPDPDWTPKQMENWESSMKEWYNKLETGAGRRWTRAVYRPKKRNSGMMTRDHVKLGTPEDYIDEHVDQAFNPWSSFTSLMMRAVGSYRADKDELETAIEDIIRAKLRVLAEHSPQRAKRLLAETNKVAELYGATTE
jgi:hypothetical protein